MNNSGINSPQADLNNSFSLFDIHYLFEELACKFLVELQFTFQTQKQQSRWGDNVLCCFCF